jgi:hypothetical protein
MNYAGCGKILVYLGKSYDERSRVTSSEHSAQTDLVTSATSLVSKMSVVRNPIVVVPSP